MLGDIVLSGKVDDESETIQRCINLVPGEVRHAKYEESNTATMLELNVKKTDANGLGAYGDAYQPNAAPGDAHTYIRIDFRSTQRKVTLKASDEFTHLVVWTPDRNCFGIENQTCSTDAHNLAANGKVNEAHLQVCEPGKKMSGWVEYQIGE